jgi:cytochrome c-type biogenesis protein CcmH/NrfG
MYLRNWTYALIKEKYFVDAILNIRRAIEINPKDPENWLMWGTVQKINGDFSSAKNKFEIALQMDPDHVLAREELFQKGLDIFIANIAEV